MFSHALRVAAMTALLGVSVTKAGASELLSRDLDVNVFKEDVIIPLTVSATEESMDGNILRVSAHANVTDVLPIMGRQVKQLILDQNSDCKFRVTSSDPEIEIVDNGISIEVTSTAEVWICTSFVKKKLVQETGTIIAAISPSVKNGSLHLNLAKFDVRDLSKVSDMLGIEKQLKKKFLGLLDDFNRDQEVSALPKVLQDHGFVYSNAALENTYRDRQTLIMEVEGPNNGLTLLKVIAALITQ